MLETVIIDRMQAQDVDEVLRIAESSEYVTRWTRKMFEQEFHIPLSTFFVARDPGVIGYAGFWEMGDAAHVVHLGVAPERRRQGLGSILLKEMLEEAQRRNLVRLTLEVHAENRAALALYAKFHFDRIGLRPKYYESGGDAVILERIL